MSTLHWFRNDLRVADNMALSGASSLGRPLGTVFVIDPQLWNASSIASNRVAFLRGALTSLGERMQSLGGWMVFRTGSPWVVLPVLAREIGATCVTWNRDYSPYARLRDERVGAALARVGIATRSYKDRVLWEPSDIMTKAGNPYSVYSPYRKAWLARTSSAELERAPAIESIDPVRPVPPSDELGQVKGLVGGADSEFEPTERAAGRRLKVFHRDQIAAYDSQRDMPAIDGTSRLSPYLRFGLVSVRTCFRAAADAMSHEAMLPGASTWRDELIWREFYLAVLGNYPGVLRRSFKAKYRSIVWDNNESWYAAWCEGRTGFPIVDAGMRQLRETGWMHNRVRMIVASFLTKDLLIDWRWGERHFMAHLLDAEPASNNGGWQWAGSTGTDAQPYFRVFNPTTQAKRFDPDGVYIGRWVGELAKLAGSQRTDPGTLAASVGYPQPIVNHSERRLLAIERYKVAGNQ